MAFAIFMFRLTRKLEHQSRLLFVKVSLGREEALSKHNNSCIVCQYMQRPTFLAYSQYDEGKAFCIWPVRKDTLQYIVQMIYDNNTLQYIVYSRITKFQYLIQSTSK